MYLRIPQFLALFLILLILTIVVSVKSYKYSLKNRKIMVILEEIEGLGISSNTPVLGATSDEEITKDIRVATLKSFFRQHNSPLYDHAEFIVKTADDYGLDFKLIPAIAMQESTLCRSIPANSHNCWGWGIYGTKVTRFNSYEEAIDTVSRGLKNNYIDNGLVTADEIMRKYNPSSPNGAWANGVNTFIKVLEI